MKILSPRIHGILDYTTVLFLLIAPSVFEMHSTASVFTMVLAIVHLTLTSLTDFPAGVLKIIPLWIHGVIELVVAVVLIGMAIWFENSGDHISFYFYLIFSVVLFVVWTLTDYKQGFPTITKEDI